MTDHPAHHDGIDATWCGDATSVVEFLRPLREQLSLLTERA